MILKEITAKNEKIPPRWKVFLNNKINSVRRKISYITLIVNCRNPSSVLTKHQKKIENRLKNWFRNTNLRTLESKLSQLNHDLKLASESLRNKLCERNSINKKFQSNQKQVFRTWKSKQQQINTAPGKGKIENFWSGIWEKETNFNKEAPWIKTLERGYCKNTRSKYYCITQQIFDSVLKGMKNNGAPGNDRIRCYWIKKLTSTHLYILAEFNKIYEDEMLFPDWLATSKTILLPKNDLTHETKNYRPIACQNIMYKIYTGIINNFLEEHCSINDIITLEQVGGKKGSWGCADQLLMNKMILAQVRNNRRNLLMI